MADEIKNDGAVWVNANGELNPDKRESGGWTKKVGQPLDPGPLPKTKMMPTNLTLQQIEDSTEATKPTGNTGKIK